MPSRAAVSDSQKNATQTPPARRHGPSLCGLSVGVSVTGRRARAPSRMACFARPYSLLYLQDTWKITPKLTAELGVRYENTPPYHDKYRGMINVYRLRFGRLLTGTLVPGARVPLLFRPGSGDFHEGLPFRFHDGNPTVTGDDLLGPETVKKDKNDFAPRISLAYRPAENWTVRTGRSVFFVQDIVEARFDLSRNVGGRSQFTADSERPNANISDPWKLRAARARTGPAAVRAPPSHWPITPIAARRTCCNGSSTCSANWAGTRCWKRATSATAGISWSCCACGISPCCAPATCVLEDFTVPSKRMTNDTYTVADAARSISPGLDDTFADDVWVTGRDHRPDTAAAATCTSTSSSRRDDIGQTGDRPASPSPLFHMNKDVVNRTLKRAGIARIDNGVRVRIRGAVVVQRAQRPSPGAHDRHRPGVHAGSAGRRP